MHPDMSSYEQRQWKNIEKWRIGKLSADAKRLPRPIQRAIDKGNKAVANAWENVPKSDEIQRALVGAADGGFRAINDRAANSINRERILRKFDDEHPVPTELAELRAFDLRVVDRHLPSSLGAKYASLPTLTGAGAGIISGIGAMATTVGALPAFGAVVGAITVDTVSVLGASGRCSSHFAAYHGYDTREPAEGLFMLSVMNVASASGQVSKVAAMRQMRSLSNAMARRVTWNQLGDDAIVKMIQKLFASMGEKLTKRKLGQAVPVLGAAIGAGLNYQFMSSTSMSAYHLYRERFLMDKYEMHDDNEIIDVEVLADEMIETARTDEDIEDHPPD